MDKSLEEMLSVYHPELRHICDRRHINGSQMARHHRVEYREEAVEDREYGKRGAYLHDELI